MCLSPRVLFDNCCSCVMHERSLIKAEHEPMREGDEVLIDFDENDFEESEDFFSVEGEEQDDDEADDEHDKSR